MILLLLYAATRHVALHAADVARIDQSCTQWRETVIRPLRAARRAAMPGNDPSATEAYSALKSAELAAERVAQGVLVREFNSLSLSSARCARAQLAQSNFEVYRSLVPMPDALVKDLLAAFARCMPDVGGVA